ncbi:hypothetical protein NA56DRAFT_653955 [Hyaloscypha hepaticicola]|uniref:Uncharacterized protein n=1 Tax=Hyaloscypha hepaticicola TaxID=2082293 RepID=A0A2J6QLD6_9HELO|nr:hypothetical protein NA56DRAFT_653955 [Hyaloscypha hepaticicola]
MYLMGNAERLDLNSTPAYLGQPSTRRGFYNIRDGTTGVVCPFCGQGFTTLDLEGNHMWGPCQKIRERVVKNIKIEEGNEGIGISGRKKETSASTSGGGTSGSTQGPESFDGDIQGSLIRRKDATLNSSQVIRRSDWATVSAYKSADSDSRDLGKGRCSGSSRTGRRISFINVFRNLSSKRKNLPVMFDSESVYMWNMEVRGKPSSQVASKKYLRDLSLTSKSPGDEHTVARSPPNGVVVI